MSGQGHSVSCADGPKRPMGPVVLTPHTPRPMATCPSSYKAEKGNLDPNKSLSRHFRASE